MSAKSKALYFCLWTQVLVLEPMVLVTIPMDVRKVVGKRPAGLSKRKKCRRNIAKVAFISFGFVNVVFSTWRAVSGYTWCVRSYWRVSTTATRGVAGSKNVGWTHSGKRAAQVYNEGLRRIPGGVQEALRLSAASGQRWPTKSENFSLSRYRILQTCWTQLICDRAYV